MRTEIIEHPPIGLEAGMRIEVRIAGIDLARVRLSDSDRAVLADCVRPRLAAETPLADKLLALELLVRRIEEQRSDGSTVPPGRADKTPMAQVTCESGRSLPAGGQS